MLLTVATPGALLLHVPPVVEILKRVVLPTHTPALPVMVPTVGIAFTDTVVVEVRVQPLALGKVV